MEEIKRRHAVEEKLTVIASHDPLTGLPNRVLLQDRINQVILSSKRDDTFCGVLFIDLDRFKFVNDTLGHQYGDKFLQLVADRLRELLREEDTISRIGGDEFIVLVSNLKNEKNIFPIAQKIKSNLNKPYSLEDHTVSCSASIGVALFPNSGTNSDELIRHADIAMYKAKKRGGDSVLAYTNQMNAALKRRVYIENCIRSALLEKSFYLVYQPIINLQTQKFKSLEALLRMKGLQKETILPSEIISVAEETGLIYPIGQWVFKEACSHLAQWSALQPLKISLNISFFQIINENFIADYKRILNETGADPSQLEFELSENLAMEHKHDVIETLNHLIALGSTVTIDHFGMGHSSLRDLKELPIHKLKIDQSFIQDSDENEESRQIIKAILSLAKSLNLEIIAEGIETETELDFVKKIGCDFGQGNYISKPLSKTALISFLHPKEGAKKSVSG